MSNIEVSRDILFEGSDWNRPRWTVEQEKVNLKFTGFSFYSSNGRITSVKGHLHTSYDNSYYARIAIPEKYPYEMPIISLPNYRLESSCPHIYGSGAICLMKSEEWSTQLSIAFIIAKTAKWLNKYDYWKCKGEWPGKGQEH
jgi:ubiquitin-protein ligase